MRVMERPETSEYHPNYQKYFDLVPAGDYLELLRQNSTATVAFFESIAPDQHDYRYAPGKWSVKELLMHSKSDSRHSRKQAIHFTLRRLDDHHNQDIR